MYKYDITKITINDITNLHNSSSKYDIFKYSLKSDSFPIETGYGIIDFEPDKKKRKQAREEYVWDMTKYQNEKIEPFFDGVVYTLMRELPNLIKEHPKILYHDTMRIYLEPTGWKNCLIVASQYVKADAANFEIQMLTDNFDYVPDTKNIESFVINIRSLIETYALTSLDLYTYRIIKDDDDTYGCQVDLKPGFRKAINENKPYKIWSSFSSLPSPGTNGRYCGIEIISIERLFAKMKMSEIDLYDWDLPYLKYASNLFDSCSYLRKVYLWLHSPNLVDFSFAFQCCSELKIVEFVDFCWRNVKSIKGLFQGCLELEEINFDDADMTSVTKASRMFCGCTKLKKVENLNLTNTRCRKDNMFAGCTAMEI